MRITDYETTKNLTDVAIELTPGEAEELCIYLHRMLNRSDFKTAYLTQVDGHKIERELSVTIERELPPMQLTA